MHYKDALWYGVAQIEKRPILNTNLFISLVQKRKSVWYSEYFWNTIEKSSYRYRCLYSTWRRKSRDKLKNLEDFIHAEDDLDPLVKMAIIHYQFEAIHPLMEMDEQGELSYCYI
jgi:hypothetical protein